MIIYQTLAGVDLETIHRCFIDAFSDYQVKIQMPLERLRLMLERRGFDPGLSIGAIADGVLVGLILNGRRKWNGFDTIYDTGTGVVPEYRRQGITNAMFNEVLKLCHGLGIRQYLLEVIQTNTPAVELYQKQGFVTVRNLECYKTVKDGLLAPIAAERITVEQLDWDLLRSFWDFEPSWQNSVASVLAVPEAFAAVIAKEKGETVGYGVVEKQTGDIPQFAVAKAFRGRGIGQGILQSLAIQSEAPELKILNVEDGHPSIQGFLEKNGFSLFIGQFEMILPL